MVFASTTFFKYFLAPLLVRVYRVCMQTRKRNHQKAIRLNVTITPVLWDAFETRIRNRGFAGISDYLQDRIRKDSKLDVVTVDA